MTDETADPILVEIRDLLQEQLRQAEKALKEHSRQAEKVLQKSDAQMDRAMRFNKRMYFALMVVLVVVIAIGAAAIVPHQRKALEIKDLTIEHLKSENELLRREMEQFNQPPMNQQLPLM